MVLVSRNAGTTTVLCKNRGSAGKRSEVCKSKLIRLKVNLPYLGSIEDNKIN